MCWVTTLQERLRKMQEEMERKKAEERRKQEEEERKKREEEEEKKRSVLPFTVLYCFRLKVITTCILCVLLFVM